MATAQQREHQRAAATILPKSTDLTRYRRANPDAGALTLNGRPRKTLDFKTPPKHLTRYSQQIKQQLLLPPVESALHATNALVTSIEMVVLSLLGYHAIGSAAAILSGALLTLLARRYGWILPTGLELPEPWMLPSLRHRKKRPPR